MRLMNGPIGSSNIKNRIDGYGHMAATEWYSAGIDKMTYIPDYFSYDNSDKNAVVISVKGIYITGNQRGSFINTSRYAVDSNGRITSRIQLYQMARCRPGFLG